METTCSVSVGWNEIECKFCCYKWNFMKPVPLMLRQSRSLGRSNSLVLMVLSFHSVLGIKSSWRCSYRQQSVEPEVPTLHNIWSKQYCAIVAGFKYQLIVNQTGNSAQVSFYSLLCYLYKMSFIWKCLYWLEGYKVHFNLIFIVLRHGFEDYVFHNPY